MVKHKVEKLHPKYDENIALEHSSYILSTKNVCLKAFSPKQEVGEILHHVSFAPRDSNQPPSAGNIFEKNVASAARVAISAGASTLLQEGKYNYRPGPLMRGLGPPLVSVDLGQRPTEVFLPQANFSNKKESLAERSCIFRHYETEILDYDKENIF